MNINITKFHPSAILPQYQTVGAAGADIHACIDAPIVLQPMERRAIPTGFGMEIPQGYEVQIRARSSFGRKYGVTMANGVLLINLGQEPFTIEPNMRIAQMVLARYERAEWTEVEELDTTERGTGGFGSTGHGV